MVSKGLDIPVELVQDVRLSPGFDAAFLEEILRERRDSKAILFVGHEPDFSQVVSALIGGGHLLFKKAGLARVDLLRQSPLEGVLVWFFPPRLLVKE
jgi:phosphohistidine phosphatase SixA